MTHKVEAMWLNNVSAYVLSHVIGVAASINLSQSNSLIAIVRYGTLGEETKLGHPEGINCFVTGDEAEEQKSRPLDWCIATRRTIAKVKIWRWGWRREWKRLREGVKEIEGGSEKKGELQVSYPYVTSQKRIKRVSTLESQLKKSSVAFHSQLWKKSPGHL